MASTFPAKSRTLHNFCLPQLKWNEGQSGAVLHRRRSVKSPSRRRGASPASPVRQPPSQDSASSTPMCVDWTTQHLSLRDSNPESTGLVGGLNKESSIDFQGSNSKNHTIDDSSNRVSSSPPQRNSRKAAAKTGKATDQTEVPQMSDAKRSKILIKIPRNSPTVEEQDPPKIADKDEDGVADKAPGAGKLQTADEETRIWNLRPRKRFTTNGVLIGKSNVVALLPTVESSGDPRNKTGEHGGEEKIKLNVSVALSKEEIEEDIFALTGSKPARRPKKRPRNIQKDLNSIFPGSWLVSITADSYKVSESSLKG